MQHYKVRKGSPAEANREKKPRRKPTAKTLEASLLGEVAGLPNTGYGSSTSSLREGGRRCVIAPIVLRGTATRVKDSTLRKDALWGQDFRLGEDYAA
jgi:hypothetical protein